MNVSETLPRPWYREFWVWFILGILSMGVASGTGVLLIGLNNAPQMVTGDYQPLGKVLVNTHERADRAEALGLSGRLAVRGDAVLVTLRAHDTDALPAQLMLRFQHPTDAGRDLTALARRGAGATWQATLPADAPDRARVILGDLQQTWWLAGRFSGAAEGRIGLAPEAL